MRWESGLVSAIRRNWLAPEHRSAYAHHARCLLESPGGTKRKYLSYLLNELRDPDAVPVADTAIDLLSFTTGRSLEDAGDLVQEAAILSRRGALPVPPPHLIELVTGIPDQHFFVENGQRSADEICGMLDDHGIRPSRGVLDFGCGCGRVIRFLRRVSAMPIHGTDFNPELVAWCELHLPFARFTTDPLEGPLDHGDGTFDLVYAYSVFTHLDRSLQHRWIAELKRVLRPGGHLLFTTHGLARVHELPTPTREEFLRGGFVTQGTAEGSNSFSAYHPESFVRTELAPGFEIVDFRPGAAQTMYHQDMWLLRRP